MLDTAAMTAIPGFLQGTEMPDAGWWKALWPDPAKVLATAGRKLREIVEVPPYHYGAIFEKLPRAPIE